VRRRRYLELDDIMGSGHNFKTVKPLSLFRKIIQIWCPQNGIVLDPFAGSGTTGHAALAVNAATDGERTSILMEQGRPDKGDVYARGLTAERVRRAITGQRVAKDGCVAITATPLSGGFRFVKLDLKVDREAVLALEREEMIDLLLTSHWDQSERSAAYLRRLPAGEHKHLFAVSSRNEGFFVVWNGPDKPAVLDRPAFREIVDEAKSAGLSAPYHVYARITTYSGPNIEFYQIPDRILEKLGFNESIHAFSNKDSGFCQSWRQQV
jgi:adenine-specific DNA-methyltransferase